MYMKETCRHKVGYAETEIDDCFQEVFKPIAFNDDDRKWMQEFLLKDHQERSRDHKQHLAALQRRYTMLKSHIDSAYEDKLAGLISEEMWREKNERWNREREQIENEIASLNEGEQEYINNGVLLIELAQHAESVYKKASFEVKRKLVEIVSSNFVLKDGTLRFDYRKPFDLLAKTDSREVWWPLRESNSDAREGAGF